MRTLALLATTPLMLLLIVGNAAHAQVHRCEDGEGTYYSQRPCTTTRQATSTRLGKVGESPAPVVSGPTSYQRWRSAEQPASPKVEEHQKFLSGNCLRLSEAIRTGPSRGVGHPVMRDLRDEYRSKCSDEDADARRAVHDDKTRRSAERRQNKQVAAQMENEARDRAYGCSALRDAIVARRQRASTDQEREALRPSEDAFNARCVSR